MEKRVEFRLSMPSVGSWNGRWSGADKNYVIIKRLGKKKLEFLGLDSNKQTSWHYNFGDGWTAMVTARILEKGERIKSNGFCGYDWMVRSIMLENEIR